MTENRQPTAVRATRREKVRVAIVGVGNCASAFVQGVQYYKDADPDRARPGPHARRPRRLPRPRHRVHGRLRHRRGQGRQGPVRGDLVGPEQHDQVRRRAEPRRAGPPRHDARRPRQVPQGEDHQGARRDRRHRRDPQGDQDRRRRLLPAGRLRAGDQVVRRAGARGRLRLRELHPGVHRPRGLLGATASRRPACRSSATTSSRRSARRSSTASWRACSHDRGVKMVHTSQLNVGGNMDFYNMLERERLESKKISKTNAVTSIMDEQLPADDVHIGPSDYVPWLTDRKWAHIRVEGQAFGDVPLNVEMKLEVWDSPNSAGIVIDAVRCCKLALNHGLGGPLEAPSSYLMKSPPVQDPGLGRARPTPRTSSPSTAARRSCRARRRSAQEPSRSRPRRRRHGRSDAATLRRHAGGALFALRRSLPTPGSSTTRSTASSSGCRTSSAGAATASS